MVQWEDPLETVVPQCENTRMTGTGSAGTVLLSSFYLAPIEYYSVLFRAPEVWMEVHDTYRKQSYRNRCVIAGANGPMALSVPVEKPPSPHTAMKDMRIADHGNWRHLHWNALVSAYNSTPFFDYYRDDFEPFYHKTYPFLHDFNEELRLLVCRLLGIPEPVVYTPSYIDVVPPGWADYRETIDPKQPLHSGETGFFPKPYYQVFKQKQGFLENLSIIDLLFNMGNEARLYLG